MRENSLEERMQALESERDRINKKLDALLTLALLQREHLTVMSDIVSEMAVVVDTPTFPRADTPLS